MGSITMHGNNTTISHRLIYQAPVFFGLIILLLSGCVRTRTIAPVGVGHSASPQSASVVFIKPENPFLQPIDPSTGSAESDSSMESMLGMGQGSSGLIIYSCPMHADVRSDRPGNCPKCGMTLKPMEMPSIEKPQHRHGDMP